MQPISLSADYASVRLSISPEWMAEAFNRDWFYIFEMDAHEEQMTRKERFYGAYL